MQELQSESSSWAASSGLAREVGCEAFRHTEVGLERTRIQKIVRFGKLKKEARSIYSPISHLAPLRPGGQLHVYPPIPSIQVPPPKQGCGEHSFTLIRQSGPEKPFAHRHRNQPEPDSHEPPLWHGWPWHWSTGSEQNGPPQPTVQLHRVTPNGSSSKQDPPFRHCPDRHWVTRSLQVLPVNGL